jgi:hypothetical protein
MKGDGLGTATNRSGGVQGGISNGEPMVFRVAFKPVATIGLPQETVDFEGGRWCWRPRAGTIPACCRARCPWWSHGGAGAGGHGPAGAGGERA